MKNDDMKNSESRVAGSFGSAVKWPVVMNYFALR
jgi:hypothetical protein